MNKIIVALVVAVLFSNSAFAQVPTASKETERRAWDAELRKLKNEKPSEFAAARKLFTFFAELLLGKLGYDVGPFDGVLDERTEVALRAYQKARQLPVTGDPLTFETQEQVKADSNAVDHDTIALPFRSVVTDLWDSGYASARGTWTIPGEEMGQATQTSAIECDREIGTCTESTAVVSGQGSDRSLSLDIDVYQIERWDGIELVTKPLQFGCTRYVRRFNKVQKSVTGIRSTTSTEGVCKELDKTEKHLILTDGFEVAQRLRRKQKETWLQLMQVSPDLFKAIEKGFGR